MTVRSRLPQSIRTDREAGASFLTRSAAQLLNALPHPMLAVARDGTIVDANAACEAFFELGRPTLMRHKLSELLPFGSPLISLVDNSLERDAAINDYGVEICVPKLGIERVADLFAVPMPGDAETV